MLSSNLGRALDKGSFRPRMVSMFRSRLCRVLLGFWSLALPSCSDTEAQDLESFSQRCREPDFSFGSSKNAPAREEHLAECSDGGVSLFKKPVCARPIVGSCPAQGATGSCRKDSDCKERSGGHCSLISSNDPEDRTCACQYPECDGDADCDAGEFCLCSGPRGGACIRGNCSSWSDCESGRCDRAFYLPDLNCGSAWVTIYACRSEREECFSDDDCEGKLLMNPACVPNLETGRRQCIGRSVCG